MYNEVCPWTQLFFSSWDVVKDVCLDYCSYFAWNKTKWTTTPFTRKWQYMVRELGFLTQKKKKKERKKEREKENAFIILKLPDVSLKTRKNETLRSTSSHKPPSYVYPKTWSTFCKKVTYTFFSGTFLISFHRRPMMLHFDHTSQMKPALRSFTHPQIL